MKPLTCKPAGLVRPSAAIVSRLWVVWPCSAAHAEAAYSFDTTPGRLPKTVVPINYAIELAPDAKELTVAGNEVIDIEVREPTTRLVLNAVNLSRADASFDDKAHPEISLDTGSETVTRTLREPLGIGPHRLCIALCA